jgi:SAM-dependent methyltransferase
MELGSCRRCGLVYNVAFDPTRVDYSLAYDNALHFSDVFRAYEDRLAEHLVARHLAGRPEGEARVMELGCGSGHFLGLLCERAGGRGIGFDPSHDPARLDPIARGRVEIRREPFSEHAIGHGADLLCFRHVLEHIADPRPFLSVVRRVMESSPRGIVYCEVPNALLALRRLSIWDLMYEHCSYFVRGSLTSLFAAQGFEVLDVREEYGGQFVGLEARVGAGPSPRGLDTAELGRLAADVAAFAAHFERVRAEWRARLADLQARGRRVALWGAGGKAVGFCALVGDVSAIATVVDVNPGKQGSFLAGTGHEIRPPRALREAAPDVVIVLNPLYEQEIRKDLDAMGLAPELLTVS